MKALESLTVYQLKDILGQYTRHIEQNTNVTIKKIGLNEAIYINL